MARKSLSTRGRVLAAGLSVVAGGVLVGVMAAGDHTADATQTTTTPAASSSDGSTGASATPYDGPSSGDASTGGFPTGNSGFSPQPQTRTGGS